MLEKWTHGSAATEQSAIGHSPQRALTLPYTFYWVMDYVGAAGDVSGSAQPRQAVNFGVFAGSRFGDVEAVNVDLPEKTWVVFDMIPLPVNKLFIDGSPLADRDFYRVGHQATAQVERGKHRIEYRFEPGAAWTVLRTSTEALFFASILVCFCLEVRGGLAFKVAARPSRRFADMRSPAYTS
jgi:hypothetical protein